MIICRHNPQIFPPTPGHGWRKAVLGHKYPLQAALDLVTRHIVTKLFPLLFNSLNTLAHQGCLMYVDQTLQHFPFLTLMISMPLRPYLCL